MSKAKLFIKGQKDPIELEDAEAKIANDLITSAKPNDTPFSIEGVWSGRKADMRYVAFPKKEKEQVKTEAMSHEEAKGFEKEIQADKKRAVEVFGAGKEFRWRDFFFERMGAWRLEMRTQIFITPYSKDSQKFEEASMLLHRYDLHGMKAGVAEDREIERLEKMAQEI